MLPLLLLLLLAILGLLLLITFGSCPLYLFYHSLRDQNLLSLRTQRKQQPQQQKRKKT